MVTTVFLCSFVQGILLLLYLRGGLLFFPLLLADLNFRGELQLHLVFADCLGQLASVVHQSFLPASVVVER